MSDEQVYAATKQRYEPRPKFARLSPDPGRATKQMAARIKFLIEFFSEDGKSMRMQEIKRGLHAYRYLEFDDAIKLLEKRRQIVVRRAPGRGHVFRVTLREDSHASLPDPFVFHRKKRKRRKKPPTAWFLERGHLMDAGQHEASPQSTRGPSQPTGSSKNGHSITAGKSQNSAPYVPRRLPLPTFAMLPFWDSTTVLLRERFS